MTQEYWEEVDELRKLAADDAIADIMEEGEKPTKEVASLAKRVGKYGYYGSYVLGKQVADEDSVWVHESMMVCGANIQEAYGDLYMEIRESYPISDGWFIMNMAVHPTHFDISKS